MKVGDVVHGFCSGAFGRDSYDCRRIEVIGTDYVVTRNLFYGTPEFTQRLDLVQANVERHDFAYCTCSEITTY